MVTKYKIASTTLKQIFETFDSMYRDVVVLGIHQWMVDHMVCSSSPAGALMSFEKTLIYI